MMSKDDVLTRAAFEQALVTMQTQREELLGLIRPLSNAMRNWKSHNDQLNIHEILVHIGHRECEYAAKPGQKVSAPAEVTLLRYLRQSRENVLARFYQLGDSQLNDTFAEEWQVAPVLEHILAHEQEQIAHIEDILAQWRVDLLARLAAKRAGLFAALLGLSAEQLLIPGIWRRLAKEPIGLGIKFGRLMRQLIKHLVLVWITFQRSSFLPNSRRRGAVKLAWLAGWSSGRFMNENMPLMCVRRSTLVAGPNA